MIRFDGLSLRRGAKSLLDDVSVAIHAGERIGLVGPNGSGKSTLLALLRGELSPDRGDLAIPASWRIAHVAQEGAVGDRSALAFVLDGDRALRGLESAIAVAEKEHDAGVDETVLADLHMRFGDAGGYTATARAEALLLGLGFASGALERPVATFSGGWRMRLSLAQALMAPSDLLLLDEPTNHLDLDAIVWLEQWLRRYEGTAVVVSHDREFLDAACPVTLAIEQGKLVRFAGNVTAFTEKRAERLRLAQGAYVRQQRDIDHLQRFVDRFKAKATKARQAQSRVKALERMTRLAPVIEESPFTFRFRPPASSPDPMLVAEGLDCGYAQADGAPRIVVRGLDLRLPPGERIGLLGANGQGKSTVVKTIAGTLAPLGGTLVPGKRLVVGYFAQHQIDMLDVAASPLVHMTRIAAATRADGPAPREQELRDYLGSFDFRGDMATATVAPFSGGEKARLALALIVWSRPNLLLLDEPTNHLDMETREALTLALAQFEGTLILVSHDRALLRATADRFLVVADGRCLPFDGDLDDYRTGALKKSTTVAAAPVVAPSVEPAGRTPRTPSRADAGRRDAGRRRKPIEERIRRIERKLAEAEAARRTIDESLSADGIYAGAERERLARLLADQAYATRDIEALEAEWLEQQALLEAVG